MDKNEKTKNDGTPVEKEMQKPNAGNDKKAPTKGKTVFTVIVAVLALVMLGGALYLKSTADGSSQGSAKSEEKAELSAITLSQKEIQIPYMKTDISSVVYTVDTAGTVQFYEFKGKSYDPIDPTGTMDVTVSLSGQQIPAKIYYVERWCFDRLRRVHGAECADSRVYLRFRYVQGGKSSVGLRCGR